VALAGDFGKQPDGTPPIAPLSAWKHTKPGRIYLGDSKNKALRYRTTLTRKEIPGVIDFPSFVDQSSNQDQST
jgi:hypothetical protein